MPVTAVAIIVVIVIAMVAALAIAAAAGYIGAPLPAQLIWCLGLFFLATPHGMWDLTSPTRD